MMTRNNDSNEDDEQRQEESLPVDMADDKTLRQETIGAVGAVGAAGILGAALPGSGTYLGGAALLGLTSHPGRAQDGDGHLTESAELALAEEPRLTTGAAAGIRIDAAFGVLELSGEVPTEADREIAEETVSHVAGVNAVENKLRVEKKI